MEDPIIVIPGKLRNKANSYEVKINPSLWKMIAPLVAAWRSVKGNKKPWWVSPNDEVKAYEQEIAWRVLHGERREWRNDEPLELRICLYNSCADSDAIKAVGDGIQTSGRILNDRQFKRIIVEQVDGPEAQITIQIHPL